MFRLDAYAPAAVAMADQLEEEIHKKLHMKNDSESDAVKSSESSSESDEEVEMVMAILTPEFSDDFHCTANENCSYEDPKSHPKGINICAGVSRARLLLYHPSLSLPYFCDYIGSLKNVTVCHRHLKPSSPAYGNNFLSLGSKDFR